MDPPDGTIHHVDTSSGHDSAFLLHMLFLNKDINNQSQFECLKKFYVFCVLFFAPMEKVQYVLSQGLVVWGAWQTS